jgi:hypothetical protein
LEIQLQQGRKKRADHFLKNLNSEKQKWLVCSRMLDTKYSTVGGDVVLAAAFLTYCGSFTQKYRKILVQKWQEHALKDNELTFTLNF